MQFLCCVLSQILEKFGEFRFEFGIEFLEFFYGELHFRVVSRALVHLVQDARDTVDELVIPKPIVFDHIRHHAFGFVGEQIVIRFERAIELVDEILKFLIGIPAPVFGQKMIVHDIYDHARIMVVFLVKPFGALPENRMGIGIRIDEPVQHHAFLDVGVHGFVFFSTNAVGHEITDFQKVAIARKINVCEEIHKLNVAKTAEVLKCGAFKFQICADRRKSVQINESAYERIDKRLSLPIQ